MYIECTLCTFCFTILSVPFASEIVTSACGWGGCYYIVFFVFQRQLHITRGFGRRAAARTARIADIATCALRAKFGTGRS
jgi:hypothetical protein